MEARCWIITEPGSSWNFFRDGKQHAGISPAASLPASGNWIFTSMHRSQLSTWPRHHIWSEYFHSIWSGRRGSNSLPPPWQGGALPDELRPHIGAFTLAPQGKTTRIGLEPTTPSVTGWCSNQLGYRAISGVIITTPLWSGRRGSNSLPPPWQGGALPDELRPHIRGTGVILVLLKGGASDRNRTNDTGIFSPLLYRLSYRGAPDDDYYT